MALFWLEIETSIKKISSNQVLMPIFDPKETWVIVLTEKTKQNKQATNKKQNTFKLEIFLQLLCYISIKPLWKCPEFWTMLRNWSLRDVGTSYEQICPSWDNPGQCILQTIKMINPN